MPKKIKKASAKPESGPVVVETKEATADTAVLEGANVEVVHDFTGFSQLNTSKLALVDKNGVDVKKSIPDWHFAWFADADAYGMENIVGFKKVHEVFGDNITAPVQSPKSREDVGQIEQGKDIDRLVAYCVPMKRYNEYNAWIQKELVIDVDNMGAVGESAFDDSRSDQYADTKVNSTVTEVGESRL